MTTPDNKKCTTSAPGSGLPSTACQTQRRMTRMSVWNGREFWKQILWTMFWSVPEVIVVVDGIVVAEVVVVDDEVSVVEVAVVVDEVVVVKVAEVVDEVVVVEVVVVVDEVVVA